MARINRVLSFALLISPSLAAASGPPAPLVYFDTAGPDMAKLQDLYGGVFGWEIGPSGLIGRDSTGVLDRPLRPDPAEKVFYLGVPDVTAALKAWAPPAGRSTNPGLSCQAW